MRELHECQAEVFRRSEKRIKERKQRGKRILMTCIPLVLCLTAFGAFMFPQLFNHKQAPEDMLGPAGTQAAMGQDEYQGLTCAIAEIKVSGNGVSMHYTDVADLLLISDQLHTYGTRAPETNAAVSEDGSDRNENADDVIGSITYSANAAYTITLITHEGVKTEYCLFGNTLRNQTTNQAYTLTYEQAKELREMLGIPQ